MITVLSGENTFEVREALAAIAADFSGHVEHFDGESLTLNQLPDLFGGSTLFASERLIVVRDFSKNTALWPRLPDWIPNVADSTHIVLIETKLDKRTSTYKAVKAGTNLQEFASWTERDRHHAEQWVGERAQHSGVKMSSVLVQHLVARVGYDQWQLASAIERLSLLDSVTKETIDQHIEAHPSENIFQLFETALGGKKAQLDDMIRTLALTNDAYAVFALLSSQTVQLAAVSSAGAENNPAKDFGIHPFVASKLSNLAQRLGKSGVRRVVGLVAQTDRQLKSSAADPWLLVHKMLQSF